MTRGISEELVAVVVVYKCDRMNEIRDFWMKINADWRPNGYRKTVASKLLKSCRNAQY